MEAFDLFFKVILVVYGIILLFIPLMMKAIYTNTHRINKSLTDLNTHISSLESYLRKTHDFWLHEYTDTKQRRLREKAK